MEALAGVQNSQKLGFIENDGADGMTEGRITDNERHRGWRLECVA